MTFVANFSTIVAVVEEGRIISNNLRKVTEYLMAICVGDIAIVAGGTIFGFSLQKPAVSGGMIHFHIYI